MVGLVPAIHALPASGLASVGSKWVQTWMRGTCPSMTG
jgi:hypothetical protein